MARTDTSDTEEGLKADELSAIGKNLRDRFIVDAYDSEETASMNRISFGFPGADIGEMTLTDNEQVMGSLHLSFGEKPVTTAGFSFSYDEIVANALVRATGLPFEAFSDQETGGELEAIANGAEVGGRYIGRFGRSTYSLKGSSHSEQFDPREFPDNYESLFLETRGSALNAIRIFTKPSVQELLQAHAEILQAAESAVFESFGESPDYNVASRIWQPEQRNSFGLELAKESGAEYDFFEEDRLHRFSINGFGVLLQRFPTVGSEDGAPQDPVYDSVDLYAFAGRTELHNAVRSGIVRGVASKATTLEGRDAKYHLIGPFLSPTEDSQVKISVPFTSGAPRYAHEVTEQLVGIAAAAGDLNEMVDERFGQEIGKSQAELHRAISY